MTIDKIKAKKIEDAAKALNAKLAKLHENLTNSDEKLWRDTCYKPNLQKAIEAGEIKQCPHCSIYFSPTQQNHECIASLKSKLEAVRNKLNEALELLK